MSSREIGPSLNSLQPQRDLCFSEKVSHSRKCLLACKSKFLAELNEINANTAKRKMSPDSGAFRIQLMEEELSELKAIEAKTF